MKSSLRYTVISDQSLTFDHKMEKVYSKHSFKNIFLGEGTNYLILAKNKDHIVGYAIVEYNPTGTIIYGNIYDSNIKHNLLYFEIYPSYRRRGLGRKFLAFTKDHFKQPIIIDSINAKSSRFYFMSGCFFLGGGGGLYDRGLYLLAKSTDSLIALGTEARYMHKVCSKCDGYILRNSAPGEDCFCYMED